MRSRKEQRQQPTSNKEGSRQRAAVKPPGYAGAPSSSPTQLDHSSRADQNDLLEQMLVRSNIYALTRLLLVGGGLVNRIFVAYYKFIATISTLVNFRIGVNS